MHAWACTCAHALQSSCHITVRPPEVPWGTLLCLICMHACFMHMPYLLVMPQRSPLCSIQIHRASQQDALICNTQDVNGVYGDNQFRYSLLCMAALEAPLLLDLPVPPQLLPEEVVQASQKASAPAAGKQQDVAVAAAVAQVEAQAERSGTSTMVLENPANITSQESAPAEEAHAAAPSTSTPAEIPKTRFGQDVVFLANDWCVLWSLWSCNRGIVHLIQCKLYCTSVRSCGHGLSAFWHKDTSLVFKKRSGSGQVPCVNC